MPGAYSPSRVMTGAAFGENQHPRITTTFLNQRGANASVTGIGARRGDPGPWLNMNSNVDFINGGTIGFSGGIVQPYSGGLGGVLTLTDGGASTYGDPQLGVPSLYGGTFQYVRVDPNDATLPAATAPTQSASQAWPGRIAYWQMAPPTPPANGTPHQVLNYVVTANPAAATTGGIAGIFLNAVLPGYYDFLQIGGIAFVLFSGAAPIGSEVQAASGDNRAQAGTSLTGSFLGWAVITAGASGQLSPVELRILRARVY